MASGTLKYNKEIADGDCGTCPEANYESVPLSKPAYRWVCSAPPTRKDFLPVKIEQPDRKLGLGHRRRCSGFALSFYESPEQARESLLYLAANNPKFERKWDYIAHLFIQPFHGVISPTDHTGHFDLHEFEHADLESHVTQVENV